VDAPVTGTPGAGMGTARANGSVSAAGGGGDGALTLGARGLSALYAGTPVSTLRMAGIAAGGSPDGDAALNAAFAAQPFMFDDF
jgi:hypothetical protein